MATLIEKTSWRQWTVIAASLALTLWIARRVKRVFVAPITAKEARAADKDRQKQIRRELRGLTDVPARTKDAA